MPDHKITNVQGKITHVFAHRFVIETKNGSVLADITPKSLELHALRVGETINVEGEQKPSELKVSRFTVGGKSFAIEHKKLHEHPHADAKPEIVLKSARDAGFETVGEPRRKPKHFEVLGRRDNKFTELHIELGGRIRKMKHVSSEDRKWRDALPH